MRLGIVHPAREAAWDKTAWLVRAAGICGHNAESLQTIRAVAESSADVLIFEQYHAGLNDVDLLALPRKPGQVWVQWWYDLICRDSGTAVADQPIVKRWGHVMRAMDLCVVKEKAFVPDYQAAGIPAFYGDQGCPDWWPDCARPAAPEFDVLVVGQDYGQRVADAAALVAAGLRVAWAGPAGRHPAGVADLGLVPPERLPDVLGRCGAALSVDYAQGVKGYVSDRLFLLCGAGAAVLHREGYGQPDCGQLPYQDSGQLVELARRLAGDPAYRADVGARAREATMAKHKISHRLAGVLRQAKRFLSGRDN